MAYTPPTRTDFIAIYPLFADVTEPAYAHWSTEAVRRIGHLEGCLADGMNTAVMLAIAHLLTKAGIGTGTDAQMAAQGASGFKSMKSGSLSLERFDNAASSSGGDWATTSYGIELWPMLGSCVAGPIVSSTGTLPCIAAFGRNW
ncbi:MULTISPECIES: DUF4054 domain-containing protein [unclassified Novosphingobium]|uniref:DUF4054 domain-containing protein n=1 Tax=unclassified Novosphingobium TaxID=2644732 RepID=UPI0013580C90|nr:MULTISPECIES: DUF4054 domain-containing protein [unclassified Novosphingobium]